MSISASTWQQALINAGLDIAQAADRRSFSGTVADGLGRLLVALGKAAGHGDQLRLTGSAGQTARVHFRHHMREAGAEALLLLREGLDRRGRGMPTNRQLIERIGRALTMPARGSGRAENLPPAGHAAGAVGAAVVAIGQKVPGILREGQPSPELEHALEVVVAHAITGVARTWPPDPAAGG